MPEDKSNNIFSWITLTKHAQVKKLQIKMFSEGNSWLESFASDIVKEKWNERSMFPSLDLQMKQ